MNIYILQTIKVSSRYNCFNSNSETWDRQKGDDTGYIRNCTWVLLTSSRKPLGLPDLGGYDSETEEAWKYD